MKPQSIQDLDKNFVIDTNIQRDGLIMYSPLDKPFEISGLIRENNMYRRMPEKSAQSVSEAVDILSRHTAGGRLRFKTNSPYIAIQAIMPMMYRGAHFTFAGSSGFDIYKDGIFYRTYLPPIDSKGGFSGIMDLNGEMHEILIHFPLYSEVADLYIGLKDGSEILPPTPYEITKPVIYYGSSITQGGCANRTGMAYENIISRHLSCEHINLGFSGNAKGEENMAHYIASLEMSAFVMDYDYNAPNQEALLQTHENFFKIIRAAQPTLPIIIAPMPKFIQDDAIKARAEIIHRTYENAIAQGDKNVYYVSGQELTALCKSEGTVDYTHPTDFGFMSMANAFEKVLTSIFNIKQ